jgi:A/G-specific adenine glycosylase
LEERPLAEARALAPAIRAAILGWARANPRDYPWRRPGVAPYEVLVAEILLKRTTATAAARVYHSIITRYPSLDALAKASEESIAQDLVTIGLQSQRARDLKRLAEYVSEKEGGEIPRDLERLLRIPGLGDYSARAILSFACGITAAVVDSNVERVLRRVFRDWMPEKISRELLQAMADELLPKTDHRGFNLGLLDLGAIVCRYIRPKCGKCPLALLCDSARC